MAASTVTYLKFLGFPASGIPMEDKPPVDPDRHYNGTHPTISGWAPGTARALRTEDKFVRSKGERVTTFDMAATTEALLEDFGPDAPVWEGAHGYGFRKISSADFKKLSAG